MFPNLSQIYPYLSPSAQCYLHTQLEHLHQLSHNHHFLQGLAVQNSALHNFASNNNALQSFQHLITQSLTADVSSSNETVSPLAQLSAISPGSPTSSASSSETQKPARFSIDEILKPDAPRKFTSKSAAAQATSSRAPPNGAESGSSPFLWPAWVYCTRYSDRPSAGPRSRRLRRSGGGLGGFGGFERDVKRPRTAFTPDQLRQLKREFEHNHYLTEERRLKLSRDLGLNECQIKIWFQNRRAKVKKTTGSRNGIAIQLMSQGLYQTSTVDVKSEETANDDVELDNDADHSDEII